MYCIMSNMKEEQFEQLNQPINLITEEASDLPQATQEWLDASRAQFTESQRSYIRNAINALGTIVTEIAFREAKVSESPEEPPTEQLVDLAQKISTSINIDSIIKVNYLGTEANKTKRANSLATSAQELKAIRQSLGLSQESLAIKLGCSRFTVNRIERGHQGITSYDMVRKLTEIRNTELGEASEVLRSAELVENNEKTRKINATRVRTLRHALGMTQKELAQEFGCSIGTVSNIECAKGNLSKKMKNKISELAAGLEAGLDDAMNQD